MLPLERKGDTIRVVDQRKLPLEVVLEDISDHRSMIRAIKELRVRGAPAIGIAGAYGVALAALEAMALEKSSQESFVSDAVQKLANARPTAVNLIHDVNSVAAELKFPLSRSVCDNLFTTADDLMKSDQERARCIGRNSIGLIKDGGRYLTHCNAGGLATSGLGTALGVFIAARKRSVKFHVYVDETRPLLQGSRITTWELAEAGVSHTLICDNMAATVMQSPGLDGIFVGADRIAANGDTANKIGTLGLAVLADHFRIPFYIVAPLTTVDRMLPTGDGIVIEERDAEEVRCFRDSRAAVCDTPVFNPAFDVTPASLITGILTEKEVHRQPYDFRRVT